MYRPIQFLYQDEINENLSYFEYLPNEYLKEYIACYWVLKSNNFLKEGINHRILPDGCIDLIFDFETKNSFVSGIMNKTEEMFLVGNQKTIGIRFLPKAIPFIIKSNGKELLNSAVESDEIFCDLREIIEKVLELDKEYLVFELLNNEMKKYFANYRINEKFGNILNYVLSEQEFARVSSISEYFNISERQISRYFNENIGVSTKEFLNILRFQKTLNYIQNNKKISKEFHDLGYYDQSHIIKDLKKYLINV